MTSSRTRRKMCSMSRLIERLEIRIFWTRRTLPHTLPRVPKLHVPPLTCDFCPEVTLASSHVFPESARLNLLEKLKGTRNMTKTRTLPQQILYLPFLQPLLPCVPLSYEFWRDRLVRVASCSTNGKILPPQGSWDAGIRPVVCERFDDEKLFGSLL